MSLEPGTIDRELLQRRAEELEGAEPQEILRWAFDAYHPDITLACSFGGPTGMALLDMSARLRQDVSVFYLDTDLLFPETYDLIDDVKRRYGIDPVAYRSRWSLDEQAVEFGEALWSRDPDLCCSVRKVEPNGRALEGRAAWIAGLRRDQADTRRAVPIVAWDEKSASSRSTRSLRGARSRSGTTSGPTTSRTTPCTSAAIPASGASTARGQYARARTQGRGPKGRPLVRDGQDRVRAARPRPGDGRRGRPPHAPIAGRRCTGAV